MKWDLFVCLFRFLTSSSTTRLYRGRVPRLTSDNYKCCHTQDSGETMTSVSAGHIILTPTQPVGSRRPQRGSNLGPAHPESRALPTELPHPPPHPPFQWALEFVGTIIRKRNVELHKVLHRNCWRHELFNYSWLPGHIITIPVLDLIPSLELMIRVWRDQNNNFIPDVYYDLDLGKARVRRSKAGTPR